MTTIQIQVPEPLANLYKNVDEKIFRECIYDSFTRYLAKIRDKLEETNQRLADFEKKYKADFETFEKNFPDTSDYQIHEDWVEWSYYFEVANAIEKEIEEFERVSGSVL